MEAVSTGPTGGTRRGETDVNETYVTIKGRLVADPTVRTTRAGAPMTSFRLASSVRRPVAGRPGAWEDAETSFYEVVTYRALAANVGVSLRKGHPVAVHGRQHILSRARDDGGTWWAVEVVADAVGHDLSYGTAAFARVSRGQGPDADRPAPPEERDGRDGFTGTAFGDPERDPYVVEGGPGAAGGGPAAVGGGPGAAGGGPGAASGGPDAAGGGPDGFRPRRPGKASAEDQRADRRLGQVEPSGSVVSDVGDQPPGETGGTGEQADSGPLVPVTDGDAA